MRGSKITHLQMKGYRYTLQKSSGWQLDQALIVSCELPNVPSDRRKARPVLVAARDMWGIVPYDPVRLSATDRKAVPVACPIGG